MSRHREQMTNDQIIMLIEMYKCEDILWNTKHPSYYNKESRTNATNNIIAALDENFGVDVTVEQVSSKIQNLRSYYGREARKVSAAERNGEEYESLWMYFSAMDCFLKNHFMPKRVDDEEVGISVAEIPLNDDDGGGGGSESDASESHVVKTEPKQSSVKLLGKRKTSPVLEPPSITSKSTVQNNIPKRHRPMPPIRPSEDEDLIFAKYLANEMRKVTDLRTKQLMKLKLQTIIFEAQT